MLASRKARIPAELRRKISSTLVTLAVDERRAFRGLGIGLSAWFLYGPATVHPDHNGYMYLAGPWMFPSLWAIFYTFVHFRPYRGSPLVKTMDDVDTNDPCVMRLVELYKSDEATRRVWWESLKLSAILFGILGTAALLLRHSLNWTLPSTQNGFLWHDTGGPGHWFWGGVIGASIGCYMALSTAYIGWGIVTWAKREGAARRTSAE